MKGDEKHENREKWRTGEVRRDEMKGRQEAKWAKKREKWEKRRLWEKMTGFKRWN